jgi:hypothetical protein
MPELKPIKLKPVSETSSETTFKKGEELKGGKGDNRPDSDFDPEQLKAGIKVELEHTTDKAKAKEIVKDHLTESAEYYKKLKVMEADMEKSEGMQELAKALKALAVLGLSRRARMDVAYKLGVAEGTKSPAVPFATEDLSNTPTDIGVPKEQLRPDYEPPVVPVRRVETPGQIAPKPCGDHEYKTPDTSTTPAKPFWRR